jgi:hypothetical protein
MATRIGCGLPLPGVSLKAILEIAGLALDFPPLIWFSAA